MIPVSRSWVIATISISLAPCLLGYLGSAAADTTTYSNCDRDCLRGYVTQYLNALVRRDSSKLPLAHQVRFTENGIALKLGQGLWKSKLRLRSYRQDFLDVHTGMAGTHVVLEESSAPTPSPAMLVLRLKVADRKITEIETMTVRNENEGAIFDVEALKAANPAMAFEPSKSQQPTREEAIRIASYYPEGLKAGSFVKVDAPFAPHAYRVENGRLMAGPHCTSRPECQNIKTQPSPERPSLTSRLIAVDEEAGIVWYRLTWNRGKDTKLVVWEAFKVYDDQIQAVEAFMKLMPASLGSGWD